MPPSIATALTLLFVLGLLVWDSKGATAPWSTPLWIPVLWMSVTGSRFVSQWLAIADPSFQASYTEGSPIDAAYFLALILAGISVLARRHIAIRSLVGGNLWIVALIVFGFISVAWSDFPLVALKRWIKTLGHPIMALIILTESDPLRAVSTVLKRCAYLLIPTSVLFIKYYPEFGRGFDRWTGEAFNNGVGLTKNDLGYICMVFGIFFYWYLWTLRKGLKSARRTVDMLVSLVFILMILWLLEMADSATSLSALALGVVTVTLLGLSFWNRRRIAAYVAMGLVLTVCVQLLFDPYTQIIEWLGRDPNLTDRTEVWADAMALQPNVLLGAGFESFWLGSRLEVLWSKWWWRPTQAHNGYIETYLNLGLIGLFLLLGLLISVFLKISKDMSSNFDWARLRLAMFVAILAFNYTEAGFKAVHFVWTIFYIIALEYAGKTGSPRQDENDNTPVVLNKRRELRRFLKQAS